MGVFTGCVLYILIWWVMLFAVLPFGTQPMTKADPHTGWRGAPQHVWLGRKIMATTLIAALVWAGIAFVVMHPDWLSFRSGWLAIPD